MGSIPSLETYDALVEHCYESVLDASHWPGLLEALVAASGRQSGAMAIRDPGQNQATVTASIRCDPTAIEAYNGHYGGIDPVRPWIATHEAGQWCHDRRDLGTGVVASHPYYREFQQAYGIDDRASIQLTGDGSRIYLAVLTAIGAQTDAAHDELLARIAPHLRRAGRMAMAMRRPNHPLRPHPAIRAAVNPARALRPQIGGCQPWSTPRESVSTCLCWIATESGSALSTSSMRVASS